MHVLLMLSLPVTETLGCWLKEAISLIVVAEGGGSWLLVCLARRDKIKLEADDAQS